MPHNVQFYILPPASDHQLSDLILQLDTPGIHIHADDAEHADALSTILWEHPKERFIPNIVNTHCPLAVIHIGWDHIPSDRTLIINASVHLLATTHIEWVIGTKDSEQVKLARKRYAHWKQQGYSLEHLNQVTSQV